MSWLAFDPAMSWLSYAGYTDPAGGRITQLNCSWTVPSLPKAVYGSKQPAWWYVTAPARRPPLTTHYYWS